jgi:hypothetical protein
MKRKEEIEHALTVLGRRMALDGASDMEVLCCGASALCVLGLLSRSTMDVDVLGVVVRDRDLDPCEVFPVEMERAIANAGLELGLADDWFNGSASRLLERGVPEGTLERSLAHRKTFGPCLTVRFLDRRDQVALKLFASMDPVDGIRHLKDLEEISPEAAEIEHALDWMAGWESSAAFRAKLKTIVEGLGFAHVLPRIERSDGEQGVRAKL